MLNKTKQCVALLLMHRNLQEQGRVRRTRKDKAIPTELINFRKMRLSVKITLFLLKQEILTLLKQKQEKITKTR